jgi:hypothetical protein
MNYIFKIICKIQLNENKSTKQWNKKNNAKKETFDFLKSDNTKEFIDALIEDENSENLIPRNVGFKTHHILKGKYGGTWMTPRNKFS